MLEVIEIPVLEFVDNRHALFMHVMGYVVATKTNKKKHE